MTTSSAEHTQSDATFRIRVTDRTLLAVIMALHALVGALVFRFGTDLQDEGLISVWARRLLERLLPDTDFYMVQAPGTCYLNALVVKLFGGSLLAGRVFKQVESLLVIWLAYHVVTRATQQTRAGVVAALATAIFSAGLHFRIPWYGTDA